MSRQTGLPAMDILLAIDGSRHASAAINLLHDLPLPPGSCIHVVSVLIPRNASDHATLQAILAQTRDLFRDRDYLVDTELLSGFPAEQLVEYASLHKPGLVVLGAKGLRATLGILLGGVAQQVVEYANCPVLVVRAPYVHLQTVALVVDGSAPSLHATRFLRNFPLPAGARVRVIHVLPPAPSMLLATRTWGIDSQFFGPVPVERSPEEEEALQKQLELEETEGRQLLDKTVRILQEGGFQAESVLAQGDAASEILEEIQEKPVDLLVAGSRGLSGFRGWLLGSVSRKLVHYADCSVLIVK